MHLHVDDDAFVRASAALVYPRLTHIGAWGDWWPGVRTAALPTEGDGERWAIQLGTTRRDRLRVEAEPGQWRHHTGFRLELEGDLEGWAEFWLEPGWGGTVVHHLLVASTRRRAPVRRLRAYRAVLRQGLWRLKDDLQTEVRVAAGGSP